MAITLQALQSDGTWAVRNAFVTENKQVISGAITAADLEFKARRMMLQWQATSQDGKRLRVHNSTNDPKPEPAKPTSTRDFTKTSTEQLQRSLRFHENDRGTMTMAEEIHRMVIVQEIGAELQRRAVPA